MKSRRHAASATLALSVLLHVGLFWYAGTQIRHEPDRPVPTPVSRVEIQLHAPAPEADAVSEPKVSEPEVIAPVEHPAPSPEPQITHAPRDDGERSAPAQTSPIPVEKPTAQYPDAEQSRQAPKQPKASSPEEALAEAAKDTPSPPEPPQSQPEVSLRDENDAAFPDAFNGRLVPLDDRTLADASLVSNVGGSSRNARIADEGFMVNLYLRRMTEQVYAAWDDWSAWQRKNRQQRAMTGTISFQVSLNGRLQSAHISRSSGSADFDRSALEAIKAVHRFAVPEDPAVTARYYRKLRFHFSTESREIGAILNAGESAG
ncbi:TonB family protein [Allohahella marinimesophila]|uniref:TonB family protein n=1 Tax=Allohahella marinimesophila TaxID=1054972 RepID=A0ABP7P4C5_9GAMM